jgi:hypothetical protein
VRGLGVALVLPLVVLLGACSEDDPGASTLPVLPSASASAGETAPGVGVPSAAAKPPEGASQPSPAALPSAARPLASPPSAATAQGASAFARYYISVLESALATSDAQGLQQLSDEGCGGCRNLISAIRQAAKSDHHVAESAFTVDFAESPPPAAGETIVDLRYRRGAGRLLDGTGQVVAPIAAEGPIDAQLRLRNTGAGWLVLGFRQVAA